MLLHKSGRGPGIGRAKIFYFLVKASSPGKFLASVQGGMGANVEMNGDSVVPNGGNVCEGWQWHLQGRYYLLSPSFLVCLVK